MICKHTGKTCSTRPPPSVPREIQSAHPQSRRPPVRIPPLAESDGNSAVCAGHRVLPGVQSRSNLPLSLRPGDLFEPCLCDRPIRPPHHQNRIARIPLLPPVDRRIRGLHQCVEDPALKIPADGEHRLKKLKDRFRPARNILDFQGRFEKVIDHPYYLTIASTPDQCADGPRGNCDALIHIVAESAHRQRLLSDGDHLIVRRPPRNKCHRLARVPEISYSARNHPRCRIVAPCKINRIVPGPCGSHTGYHNLPKSPTANTHHPADKLATLDSCRIEPPQMRVQSDGNQTPLPV